VLDEKCIEVGGRRYAWAIPLALPVTSDEASSLSRGGSVALRDEAGAVVGIVDELECFAWDKARYVEKVYCTRRFDHPGGRAVEGDPRDKLLGGALRALPQAVDPDYGEYMLSPRITRALIRERKWERALAFQTRNPLHRAHEYALVAGAEKLTRAGHFTGVILNPLVGELKGDDVPAVTRMRCYRLLHDAARPGGQGRGALGVGGLRPERRLRADRARHEDVLRRAERGDHARDLPPEPRLLGPRGRAQARRRTLRGRIADLGRLRRAGFESRA
jgi:sulfate adenylyltransferase